MCDSLICERPFEKGDEGGTLCDRQIQRPNPRIDIRSRKITAAVVKLDDVLDRCKPACMKVVAPEFEISERRRFESPNVRADTGEGSASRIVRGRADADVLKSIIREQSPAVAKSTLLSYEYRAAARG